MKNLKCILESSSSQLRESNVLPGLGTFGTLTLLVNIESIYLTIFAINTIILVSYDGSFC